jgi:nuclear transport factor 2 (NTF2) superfamily protein
MPPADSPRPPLPPFDLATDAGARLLDWPHGRWPDDHPGLTALGL